MLTRVLALTVGGVAAFVLGLVLPIVWWPLNGPVGRMIGNGAGLGWAFFIFEIALCAVVTQLLWKWLQRYQERFSVPWLLACYIGGTIFGVVSFFVALAMATNG